VSSLEKIPTVYFRIERRSSLLGLNVEQHLQLGLWHDDSRRNQRLCEAVLDDEDSDD
jgi:hypothetical protein